MKFIFPILISLAFLNDAAAFLGIGGETKATDPVTTCVTNAKATVASAPQTPMGVQAATAKVSAALESCIGNGDMAQNACLESLSPHIQQAAGLGGLLMSGMSAMNGAKEKCQKTSDTADLIKGLLTAYNSVCGGLKLYCEKSCANVASVIQEARTVLFNATTTVPDQQKIELSAFDTYAAKVKKDLACFAGGCGKYGLNLASAGLGIAEMLKQKGSADQCVAQLTQPTPVTGTDVNCSDPANDANVKCICMKNPRAYGCVPATTAGDTATPVTTDSGVGGVNGGPGAVPSLGNAPFGGGGVDGGAGSGGAGSGGGGSGPGSGGGGSGGYGGFGGAGKKGFDTNIYGGSGGGGGRSGGGGGWSEKNGGLPVAAPSKEQQRKIAAAKEISGKGKTNWEKVRDSFISNRKTFIGR